MFEKFMWIDKLALIAALMHITNADDTFNDQEAAYLEDLLLSKGFEDFDHILEEYESHVQSHEEYIDLLRRVYRQDVQAAILQECIGIMGADREQHAAEADAVREICAIWGKNPDDILRGHLAPEAG